MGAADRIKRLIGSAPADDHGHEALKPGTAEYDEHVAGELKHYTEIFERPEAQKTLTQPVPTAWHELERRAAERVKAATGDVSRGHLVSFLRSRPGMRMLSLGCGPGGVEIDVARDVPDAAIVGIDLNDELLELGRTRAKELGVNVSFEHGDLNLIDLADSDYDAVWCHASLHHVLELERLAGQIERSLRPGGRIFVVDVISRNGYLFWPENGEVARAIFRELPERLRVNHTGYGKPRLDKEIWEANTAADSMECIRSEDIVPVFRSCFESLAYVPYFAICRRFFDTMYGPNYDLTKPFDRMVLDGIWRLDTELLLAEKLRPETFFGVFARR